MYRDRALTLVAMGDGGARALEFTMGKKDALEQVKSVVARDPALIGEITWGQ